jgi:hypothetical protein
MVSAKKRTVRFVPRRHEPDMDMFTEGAACALAETHDTRAIYQQVCSIVVEETQDNGAMVRREVDISVQEVERREPAGVQSAPRVKTVSNGARKRA